MGAGSSGFWALRLRPGAGFTSGTLSLPVYPASPFPAFEGRLGAHRAPVGCGEWTATWPRITQAKAASRCGYPRPRFPLTAPRTRFPKPNIVWPSGAAVESALLKGDR